MLVFSNPNTFTGEDAVTYFAERKGISKLLAVSEFLGFLDKRINLKNKLKKKSNQLDCMFFVTALAM